VKVRDGEYGIGLGWFSDNISKEVGNGRETYFWTDPWLRGIPLAMRFRRLFELSVIKLCTVDDMFVLGWVEGVKCGSGRGVCESGRRRC